MLWVLRGLKCITKLICPLHRQPCSLPPSLLTLFTFPLFVIREWRGQRAIALQRLATRGGLWFLDFWSFVLPSHDEKNLCYEICVVSGLQCLLSNQKGYKYDKGGMLLWCTFSPHAGDGCAACSGMLQPNSRQCGSMVGGVLLSQLFMCVFHVNCNSTPLCSFHSTLVLLFSVNASMAREKKKERREKEEERELDRQRPFVSKLGAAFSSPTLTVIVKNVIWNPHSAVPLWNGALVYFQILNPCLAAVCDFPRVWSFLTSLPSCMEKYRTSSRRPSVIHSPLCRAVPPGGASNPEPWSEPQREKREKPPTATASWLYEEP